ncbi:hypothetical protein TrLO_g10242 [Triparma laevis f. longispina]|uniref:Uncharacterized protein n=1 Tax=Triparma laevis f. longispina TaxID=1714387 RepID=A0A9W7DQX2_9STRA|nr:hypothetical protein TrLO_g10242 [Triparma laevis f. longispina]
MGGSSSTCKPCSNPCPDGFTYSENCAWWWWESDEHTCTPDETPSGAEIQSILEIHYTGCPCSTFGNCEGTVKRAEKCASDQNELSLVEECCRAPFSNAGCQARYGSHETRTCVKDEVTVFALQDGARTCPDQFFKEWGSPEAFSVCRWCDGEVKMDENGSLSASAKANLPPAITKIATPHLIAANESPALPPFTHSSSNEPSSAFSNINNLSIRKRPCDGHGTPSRARSRNSPNPNPNPNLNSCCPSYATSTTSYPPPKPFQPAAQHLQ